MTEQESRTSDPAAGFFDSIRGAIFTSIPALAALVFVVVAVKVFRASRMETTTTVAIVSNADDFQLLKGIVLTLLPGLPRGARWRRRSGGGAAVLPERLEGPTRGRTPSRRSSRPRRCGRGRWS